VRDPTSGFRCFTAEALGRIDGPGARAHGYAFQVELAWRAVESGLRVVEVPITFRARRRGRSKLSARVALEAAWRVPALRVGPRRWRPLTEGGVPADPCGHES
jgi:dolichol-phosphate mannosyltransferase